MKFIYPKHLGWLMLTGLNLFILACSDRSTDPGTPGDDPSDPIKIWGNIGPGDKNVISLYLSADNMLFAGTENELWRTSDGGSTWEILNFPSLPVVSISGGKDLKIFAVGNSGVFLSRDFGESWQPTALAGSGLTASAANPNGEVLAGNSDGVVFRLSEEGNILSQSPVGQNSAAIKALAVAGNNVYLAGTFGEGLFRSPDNGNTWEKMNLENNFINAIAVNSSGDIFAGTIDRAVYRLTSGGSQWENIGPLNIANRNVLCLLLNSQDDLFMGSKGSGVYVFRFNEERWIPFNDQQIDFIINTLVIDKNDFIYAGSASRGVLRTLQPSLN